MLNSYKMDDSEEDELFDEDGNKLPIGLPYPLVPIRAPPPKLGHDGLECHIYGDNSAYAGDWRRGMRSGWGVFNSSDGCQYVGVRAPP